MEIHMTWIHLVVILSLYLLYQYARSCYRKLYDGCDSPYNPFVPYESPELYRQWHRGYEHGKLEVRQQYAYELGRTTEKISQMNDELAERMKSYSRGNEREDLSDSP
ncbi:hypothetical protein ABDD95_07405 [Mucilaginibacter sp. PAMB04274]|uniref:hypothetical protein n=1 Tax=Mucilaginibacter sp. PAMB04274 TaxID=3138568 RepID=UPI0031F6555A